MRDVIVVGGGASGLAAAIEAARGGCAVTLLEQKERTGKKILATGNGRCNLTNRGWIRRRATGGRLPVLPPRCWGE